MESENEKDIIGIPMAAIPRRATLPAFPDETKQRTLKRGKIHSL